MEKHFKNSIFKIVRIVIPIVLLFIIFYNIDFNKLKVSLLHGKLFYLLIPLLSVPILNFLFSLRWHILLRKFWKIDIKIIELITTYYKGIFLGYFIPSSLGIDVYRTLKFSKNKETIPANITIVITEKIIGLLSCIFLIGLSYPFIEIDLPSNINKILSIVLSVGLILILILFSLIFFSKRLLDIWVVNSLKKFLEKKYISIMNVINKKGNNILINTNVEKSYKIFLNKKFLLTSFLFGIIIHFTNAFFVNIIFKGFGYDLPLQVNLFANSILTILIYLPVSLGGVGVREAGYILLFGLFGVTKDICLLVSLLLFSYIILNIMIGGLLLIGENVRLNNNS